MGITRYQREFLSNFGASYSSQKEIYNVFKAIFNLSNNRITSIWKSVARELDEETFNELCMLIKSGDDNYIKSYKYKIIYKRHEENLEYILKARHNFLQWSNRILKIYATKKKRTYKPGCYKSPFQHWLKENQQFIIENHSILSASEIAESLGVTPSKISHARDILYKKELIFKRDRIIPKKERRRARKKEVEEQLEYEYQQIIKIVVDSYNKKGNKNEK